jgi:4-hydroxybenzoate polyprenyltransferase
MPEAPTASQPLRLWTMLCLYTLLIGAVYIANQITDRETDAVNNKLYLVARGYVKLKVLKWQIGVLMTLSILLSLLVFPRNLAYLTLISLSIILGFAYSVRRFVIFTVSTLVCCNTTICPLVL